MNTRKGNSHLYSSVQDKPFHYVYNFRLFHTITEEEKGNKSLYPFNCCPQQKMTNYSSFIMFARCLPSVEGCLYAPKSEN